jgi:Zn-dependent protease with chaperone function
MLRRLALCLCTILPACAPPAPPDPVRVSLPAEGGDPSDLRARAASFVAVLARVEPLAEAECRARAPQRNCDFRILVDDRPGMPPNAFQTVDPRSGRPVIAVTLGLIADVRNQDELAFILSHEAAHHIAGHIEIAQQTAMLGAAILGQIAGAGGASPAAIRDAEALGAFVGARTYSQAFELEADALGAVIAARAGYDPLRGAEFFFRIPDPGNRFLGTHPPNAERLAVVRQTVAELGL